MVPHFELQGRDNGAQVGISAALTVAVDRTLYLPRTCADGTECIRHRELAVVMGMNAERGSRQL
ncbi:hypothetical protein D3C76_667600 [compost metagenome]